MTSLAGTPIFKGKNYNAKRISAPKINSWDQALTAGATLTGLAEEVTLYPTVSVAVKTDQPGTLYMEQSPNGINWDLVKDYSVSANISFERLGFLTRRYYRTRFVSSTSTDHTFFRLQTSYADYSIGAGDVGVATGLKRLCWNTNVDWAKGSLASTLEINGTGDAAVIQLKAKTNNDDDIDYETPGDYTLSDGTKVEVTAGLARLKAITGTFTDYPFTTPGNYTYNGSDIEVTSGVAQLKSQIAADMTFYANYDSNIDGTWGDGDLTGSAIGGAAVSGGKLDLSFNDARYVDYDADLNADSQVTGCVRFLVTPNYTGSPASTQIFTCQCQASGNTNNLVQIQHQATGPIRFAIFDSTGVTIVAYNAATWSPTSGVEYEIEFNFDLTPSSEAHRIFIDGVLQGSVQTQAGTRSSSIGLLRVGNNANVSVTANFKIDDLIIFDAVQHTAGYTPGASIPQTKYLETDPTITNNTGFAFTSALGVFVELATKTGAEIKYQNSSDDGTTYKWWNGSAWVARTPYPTPTAVRIIAGTLNAGNLASLSALDADVYDVSETTGTPGLEMEMDISNVGDTPDNVVIYGYYSGVHTLDVDIWDYNATSWVTLGQMATGGGAVVKQTFAITGTKADKVSSGVVLLRLNQPIPGNINHKMVLDWVYTDKPLPDSWYYANETNTATDINTNIASLAASGTFKFLAFLHSSDGTQTPIITNLQVGEAVTYSTNDDFYIDTKDASQITVTDLVVWSTATVANNNPASTFIGLMISVDGRVTWETWTGSWTNPVDPTDRSEATSIADFQTNVSALDITNKKMDVRLFLKTDVNTLTPTVLNINVTSNAGFETSGVFSTNQYDSAVLDNDWDIMSFIGSIGAGGAIVVKAKAENTSAELTAASYGPSIPNGDDAGVVGQWVQFEVTFTGNGSETTSMEKLCVDFEDPIREIIVP